jgi:hypothetical protein
MNIEAVKSPAMFDLPTRHKRWRPCHLSWVMRDLAGVARQPEKDHRNHLRVALEWVCRAQDACDIAASGGASAGWTFESGWLLASADATGWLIETPLPAAAYPAWPAIKDRARAALGVLLAHPDQGTVGRIYGLIAAGHVQLGHAESRTRAVLSGHLLKDVT